VAEQRNDNVKALKLADEIAHKWPQAPATPYALYMKGLACDSGPDCDYPEAVKCFRELYTRYPDSPLAEAARFEEIFRGINSRNLEQRRSWIEKFKRDYPRSKYLEPLDAYIRLLEKWAAEDKIRVEKRAAEAGNKIPENKPDAPRK
jgi:outer membrane protein assembly factor BamD (BamD/ComL family)